MCFCAVTDCVNKTCRSAFVLQNRKKAKSRSVQMDKQKGEETKRM